VFALILVRGSFAELPIAHKALSRWVVALVTGVKTLKKVVTAEKELVQSLRVIGPREISIIKHSQDGSWLSSPESKPSRR
jgi:hypothetical protein